MLYRLLVQAIVCTMLLMMVPATSLAADPPSTMTVAGQGTIERDPDQATLALSVVTSNDSAATATSMNNQTYNSVLSSLRGIGLTDSAVKTVNFDVTFVAKPPPNATYKPPHTGYVVTRALSVTIANLSLVGKAIDAAVGAGVEQIGGVSYGLHDQRSAYAAALAAAVQDAQAQATALAGAAHVHLGAIRAIVAAGAQPPRPMMAQRLAVAAPAVPTEISPSQVQVQATVTVTYGISPS